MIVTMCVVSFAAPDGFKIINKIDRKAGDVEWTDSARQRLDCYIEKLRAASANDA
jgi:hypothetical protein